MLTWREFDLSICLDDSIDAYICIPWGDGECQKGGAGCEGDRKLEGLAGVDGDGSLLWLVAFRLELQEVLSRWDLQVTDRGGSDHVVVERNDGGYGGGGDRQGSR